MGHSPYVNYFPYIISLMPSTALPDNCHYLHATGSRHRKHFRPGVLDSKTHSLTSVLSASSAAPALGSGSWC